MIAVLVTVTLALFFLPTLVLLWAAAEIGADLERKR